ncbi:hypothetical protein QBC38DRAFT_65140 [Podospora fimiseda]|uniref:Infection structure specific protein n=1 Tax=Podospora fimiseda TaxID=252190 RepID=A0AAN6YPA7_9PEZI|nr:hypothetical protein QBC38DRAFT_65140 [Podospora fimiseda]
MHPSTLLLLLTSTTITSANLIPGHLAIKRAADSLQPRQTSSPDFDLDLSACYSTLTEVLKSVPTPPPAILTFAITQTATDPCDVVIPKTLSSVYSSYGSVLAKWYATAGDSVTSALKQCPGYEELTQGLDVPLCTGGGPGGIGGGNADAASTTTTTSVALATGSGGEATPAPTPAAGGGSSQQSQGGDNKDGDDKDKPAEGAASSIKGVAGVAGIVGAFIGVIAVL